MNKMSFKKCVAYCAVFLCMCACQQKQHVVMEVGMVETALCGEKVFLELAVDPEERMIGLMNRSRLKSQHGMVFVFEDERRRSFWMKNVSFPISIGFFDSLGRMVSSTEMVPELSKTPESSYRRYSSTLPARFAVEMPKNWFLNKTSCEIDLRFLNNILGD